MKSLQTALTAIILLLLLSVLLGYPIKWCWNYLMPAIFDLQEIGFKQALVMNILASLLFKSNASTTSE